MDTSGYLDLLAYALLAMLTPLGFAATVAVIESGRLKAFAFALGVVAAQLATCAVLVLVGASAGSVGDHDHPTFRAVVELCFGLTLVLLAFALRRRPQANAAAAGGRAQASLERLRHLHVGTALAAGLVLGVGGPKRLVLTTLAAASIAASTSRTTHLSVLVVGYTVVATFLVWAPVVAYELFGEHIVTSLRAGQEWLRRHQRGAVFYPLFALGILAIVDALATLQ